MKKSVLLAMVIFLAVQAKSQTLRFGIKAGINQGSLSKAPSLDGNNTTTGFVGGFYGRAGILGMFVQPELLYSQRRGVFKDSIGRTVTNTLSYIDIPVLFGYKLLAFRGNIGPNFQFLASARQEGDQNLKDKNFSKSNFNSAAVGFQVGIGVDLGKISIDARYDGSIGNLGKKITNAAGQQVDYSTRSSMFQFTLGYRIL